MYRVRERRHRRAFYYYTGPTDGFTGLEMRDGQVVGTYHTPQLQ